MGAGGPGRQGCHTALLAVIDQACDILHARHCVELIAGTLKGALSHEDARPIIDRECTDHVLE
ncbi:hypothetical protein CKO25_11420 [Thiocapsa imhoffii]|uniref:Uncharacterized protein n=1 Tax=Thiocapsa imhoffii TaxID=382777 RepID=A0A9X0WIM3_9GAMM|nr:hypothetical protein [Thiocapsa imhoffii]